MKNKPLILITILTFLFIGYFALSETDQKNRKKTKSEKLSLLTGSLDDDSEEISSKKKRDQKTNKSIWDSENKDFIEHGVNNKEEEIPSQASNVGDIPNDPNTDKPYTEEAMAQFEELRKEMPANELIPRRTTKEEREKQMQLKHEWNKARVAVDNGNYTREDLETHFGRQRKIVEDRLQIIEYMLEAQKEDGEVDKDGQFQKLLDFNKDQLKQMELTKQDLERKAR